MRNTPPRSAVTAREATYHGSGEMEIGRIGVWTFELEQQPWSAVEYLLS
jgi:hypothetical protein